MTIMILSYISLTTIKPPYIYHGITTIKPPFFMVYPLMGWGLLCLKIPFGNRFLPGWRDGGDRRDAAGRCPGGLVLTNGSHTK